MGVYSGLGARLFFDLGGGRRKEKPMDTTFSPEPTRQLSFESPFHCILVFLVIPTNSMIQGPTGPLQVTGGMLFIFFMTSVQVPIVGAAF